VGSWSFRTPAQGLDLILPAPIAFRKLRLKVRDIWRSGGRSWTSFRGSWPLACRIGEDVVISRGCIVAGGSVGLNAPLVRASHSAPRVGQKEPCKLSASINMSPIATWQPHSSA
jgi:hypothetical protein